jgi:hypothetical protein
MKFVLSFFLLLSISKFSFAAVIYETSGVDRVGSSFEADKVCVYLSNGKIARLDVATETGKAELSIALAAQISGKNLRIGFNDSLPLVGGCNSGTTIRPHAILTIQS